MICRIRGDVETVGDELCHCRRDAFRLVTDDDYRQGAALSFSGDVLSVKFTDAEQNVTEEYSISLPSGSVEKY